MKRIFKLFIAFFMSATLFACGGTTPKEFKKEGITITLTSEFVEGSNINAQVLYTSNKEMFMGNRFLPSYYPSTIIIDKDDPTAFADYLRNEAYLQYDNNPSDYSTEETGNDGTKFAWIYYDNTVSSYTYTYMLVVKISDSYVYVMNFATLKSEFASHSDNFMTYAKSIVVE